MTIRTDEDFFAAVGRQDEPITGEERKQVLEILGTKAFQKVSKAVLLQTDEMKNRFLRFNLSKPEEQSAASRLQGQIAAYAEVFGLLVSEALMKEETNDETQPVETTGSPSP